MVYCGLFELLIWHHHVIEYDNSAPIKCVNILCKCVSIACVCVKRERKRKQ